MVVSASHTWLSGLGVSMGRVAALAGDATDSRIWCGSAKNWRPPRSHKDFQSILPNISRIGKQELLTIWQKPRHGESRDHLLGSVCTLDDPENVLWSCTSQLDNICTTWAYVTRDIPVSLIFSLKGQQQAEPKRVTSRAIQKDTDTYRSSEKVMRSSWARAKKVHSPPTRSSEGDRNQLDYACAAAACKTQQQQSCGVAAFF
jgi:hypothetical protein